MTKYYINYAYYDSDVGTCTDYASVMANSKIEAVDIFRKEYNGIFTDIDSVMTEEEFEFDNNMYFITEDEIKLIDNATRSYLLDFIKYRGHPYCTEAIREAGKKDIVNLNLFRARIGLDKIEVEG